MPYEQIHLKVITLRDDFRNSGLKNLDLIAPPVFTPYDLPVNKKLTFTHPIKIGFLGNSGKRRIWDSFWKHLPKPIFLSLYSSLYRVPRRNRKMGNCLNSLPGNTKTIKISHFGIKISLGSNGRKRFSVWMLL